MADAAQPPNPGRGENAPNRGNVQNRDKQNNNNRNYNNSYANTDSNFEGATTEIDGVLVLPAETHTKARVGFTKFKDLI